MEYTVAGLAAAVADALSAGTTRIGHCRGACQAVSCWNMANDTTAARRRNPIVPTHHSAANCVTLSIVFMPKRFSAKFGCSQACLGRNPADDPQRQQFRSLVTCGADHNTKEDESQDARACFFACFPYPGRESFVQHSLR